MCTKFSRKEKCEIPWSNPFQIPFGGKRQKYKYFEHICIEFRIQEIGTITNPKLTRERRTLDKQTLDKTKPRKANSRQANTRHNKPPT